MTRIGISLSAISLLVYGMAIGYPFSNTPDWGYPESIPLEPPLYTDLASWDFDSDNIPELAACCYSYDPVNPTGGSLILLEITNSNQLDISWTAGLIAGYQCLLWADVDGDRDMDLVAGTSIMIPNPSYTSVVYFENNEGTLSNAHENLSGSSNWDVMDLQLGDFNFDSYPDILVLRAGDTPMILEGRPALSLTGWTIEQPVEQEIIGVTFRGFRASVWDVNGDDYLDLACGNMYQAFELLSCPDAGGHIQDQIRRGPDCWFSVAYTPPYNNVPRTSITTGNAWGAGICTISSETGDSWSSDVLRDPEGDEHYVEFASDIELVSVIMNSDPMLLLAVSEAGAISETEGYRHRRSMVFELEREIGGWGIGPELGLEETEDSRRPESFSVCWCDLNNSVFPLIETVSFTGGGYLFHLGEALGDDFVSYRSVQRIVSAYRIPPFGRPVAIDVWYSGNGWFGCVENIPADNGVEISYLTSDEPDLFFGRRGVVEGYCW